MLRLRLKLVRLPQLLKPKQLSQLNKLLRLHVTMLPVKPLPPKLPELLTKLKLNARKKRL